jgi:Tfp pilus assembly protein PilF
MGRTNVYVLVPELDEWLIGSSTNGAAAPSPMPITPRRRWLLPAAFAAALSLLLVASLVAPRAHSKSASRTTSYTSSRLPGVDDLYLRAVYFNENRTPDSLGRAEKILQQTLSKDPNFAPAWSALAITHILSREYSTLPDAVAYARAREEAQRALALDPSLSDAHATMAFITYFWDERPAAAEQEFLTALRLNPNSALAHQWYGSILTHEGRFADALQQLEDAQRLQPNSTAILASRAYALGLSGQRDQAIDLLRAITEEDPNYSGAHFRISVLCMAPPANVPCALREQRRWATLMRDDNQLAANAVADLQKLAAGHDTLIMGINMNPEFRTLRRDPRFQRLDASLGLPQVP